MTHAQHMSAPPKRELHLHGLGLQLPAALLTREKSPLRGNLNVEAGVCRDEQRAQPAGRG